MVIIMQKDEMQYVISLSVVTSANLILSEPQQVVWSYCELSDCK